MRPVDCIPPSIEEMSESIPIEIIGEKSILPKRSHPYFEKKFMYGSQTLEINFPNRVNFAPGIQVIIMSTKQSRVYMVITAESKDKIVATMFIFIMSPFFFTLSKLLSQNQYPSTPSMLLEMQSFESVHLLLQCTDFFLYLYENILNNYLFYQIKNLLIS